MNKLRLSLLISFIFLSIVSCSERSRTPIFEHFWAPDSFSPNNDGLNEEFYLTVPPYVQVTNFNISIYNENLQLMYESNDITDGWNGNYEVGMEAPAGYYDYQILYTASTDSITYDDYITSSKINLVR